MPSPLHRLLRLTPLLPALPAAVLLSCRSPTEHSEPPASLASFPSDEALEAFQFPDRLDAEPPVDEEDPQPMEISVEDAVLLALENNRELHVERLRPVIAGSFEELERGAFSPEVFGEVSGSRERTERFPDELDEPIQDTREGRQAQVGVRQFLPSGTDLELGLSHQLTDSDRVEQSQHRTRASVSATQALMRGRGHDANLAALRQARLDTLASKFEFRAFAESLAAEVENAYWDYVLTHRELEIFSASTELAERQRDATRDRIDLGQISGVEITAAEAELALRRQELINAQRSEETARLRLIRLLNPQRNGATDWDRPVHPLDSPSLPEIDLHPAPLHTRVARLWRPEIHESRLRMASRELEVTQTKNGLLPQLDFFITLGKTGFADSFGQASRNLDGEGHDARLGVRGAFEPDNRQNRARHHQARASLQQAEESIHNLLQLVEFDVRTAHAEVLRAQRQIEASAVTRAFQEEVLQTETEKFENGLSTSLDVALVQRDVLRAQIAEVEAVIDYRKAFVELYRLEGTLLIRRGIDAPGIDPLTNLDTHPPLPEF